MLFTINGIENNFQINHLPLYYRASNLLVTQDNLVEVVGEGSSGEVEPLIIKSGGKLFLGIGSDHTDRELEVQSVAFSKQICPKPVSNQLWDFEEVKDHIDQLEMQSWLDEGMGWTLYQTGTLAAIRPLIELIEKADLKENSAMLCGTFAAIGGVRKTPKFKMSLVDPILGRTLEAQYNTVELPSVK